MPVNKLKTVFSNGTNRKMFVVAGGTAGSFTAPTSVGLAAGDTIDQVLKIKTPGAALTSCVDLTSEFTNPVAAANTVSNAAGTNTTGCFLYVFFNDQNPNA